MVAEQERSSIRSLQAEVDELRSKPRSSGSELPLTDEAKEYRYKLMLAEQQIENMQVELRELHGLLNDEKRRIRSVSFGFFCCAPCRLAFFCCVSENPTLNFVSHTVFWMSLVMLLVNLERLKILNT